MTLATADKSWQVKCHSVDKGRNVELAECHSSDGCCARLRGRSGRFDDVGYPRLVKSLSKRRSETFKLGTTPEDLDIHPRLIANFSSMPRKLRSERREKIDEDLEIWFVVKGRRESGVVDFKGAVR